jgi:hypothetical protein
MGTPGDGGLVGKDADDIGPALDLAVETFERVGGVDLGTMLLGKGHVGEDVLLGLVEQGGQLRQLGPDLVGHLAPLGFGGVGMILGKGSGDASQVC